MFIVRTVNFSWFIRSNAANRPRIQCSSAGPKHALALGQQSPLIVVFRNAREDREEDDRVNAACPFAHGEFRTLPKFEMRILSACSGNHSRGSIESQEIGIARAMKHGKGAAVSAASMDDPLLEAQEGSKRMEIQWMTKYQFVGDLIPILSLQSAVLREKTAWPADRSLTALKGNSNLQHPRTPAR